jgi:hypothetical protein
MKPLRIAFIFLAMAALSFSSRALAESAEDLVNQFLDQQEQAMEAMLTIKDAASADKAIDRVLQMHKNNQALAAKLNALQPPPDEATKKAILDKMVARVEQMAKKRTLFEKHMESLPPEALAPFERRKFEIFEMSKKAADEFKKFRDASRAKKGP